ncbi:hypothetical protein SLEP1_g3121 [Rubroshorea leprosula]|uniref:Uncharacterized protein n=1 Tax=Rubroshorea leprosula TaxID=152421 RepID=A0AAV5HJB1_9ROSI|nr:hypothetical protein SLEP1_g3121 [Rubroshorea leprosula]
MNTDLLPAAIAAACWVSICYCVLDTNLLLDLWFFLRWKNDGD